MLGIHLATDQQPQGLQHVVAQVMASSMINTGRYFASRVTRLTSVRVTGKAPVRLRSSQPFATSSDRLATARISSQVRLL